MRMSKRHTPEPYTETDKDNEKTHRAQCDETAWGCRRHESTNVYNFITGWKLEDEEANSNQWNTSRCTCTWHVSKLKPSAEFKFEFKQFFSVRLFVFHWIDEIVWKIEAKKWTHAANRARKFFGWERDTQRLRTRVYPLYLCWHRECMGPMVTKSIAWLQLEKLVLANDSRSATIMSTRNRPKPKWSNFKIVTKLKWIENLHRVTSRACN